MNHSKIPPYNTGKVSIGAQFEQRPSYAMSDFEYRLQRSFLSRNERSEAAYYFVGVLALVLFAGLVVVACT